MQRSRKALLQRRVLEQSICGRNQLYKVSLSLVVVLWGLLFLLNLWIGHGDGYKDGTEELPVGISTWDEDKQGPDKDSFSASSIEDKSSLGQPDSDLNDNTCTIAKVFEGINGELQVFSQRFNHTFAETGAQERSSADLSNKRKRNRKRKNAQYFPDIASDSAFGLAVGHIDTSQWKELDSRTLGISVSMISEPSWIVLKFLQSKGAAQFIKSDTKGRASFKINYKLLRKRDVRVTMFVFGKIIMDTMARDVKKQSMSSSKPELQQEMVKRQQLIVKHNNLSEPKITKKHLLNVNEKSDEIAKRQRGLVEKKECQEAAKNHQNMISKENVGISQDYIAMNEENSKDSLKREKREPQQVWKSEKQKVVEIKVNKGMTVHLEEIEKVRCLASQN